MSNPKLPTCRLLLCPSIGSPGPLSVGNSLSLATKVDERKGNPPLPASRRLCQIMLAGSEIRGLGCGHRWKGVRVRKARVCSQWSRIACLSPSLERAIRLLAYKPHAFSASQATTTPSLGWSTTHSSRVLEQIQWQACSIRGTHPRIIRYPPIFKVTPE